MRYAGFSVDITHIPSAPVLACGLCSPVNVNAPLFPQPLDTRMYAGAFRCLGIHIRSGDIDANTEGNCSTSHPNEVVVPAGEAILSALEREVFYRWISLEVTTQLGLYQRLGRLASALSSYVGTSRSQSQKVLVLSHDSMKIMTDTPTRVCAKAVKNPRRI
ncbi:uncharacterized protein ARMOST_08261 [Armillaria ostoyae]|uniref:Uncharacterized protein n=1 Tax=Armillaria ostoyae TaxID=47428 RepID=A0A284R858_ARMOS|nr:uncharacterized protein ARMOST_08261 [Armillaria ostoyae]